MHLPRLFALSAALGSGIWILLVAEVFAADGPVPVPATGYFVDCETGNDSADGTSYTSAWRTLDKVNRAVTAAGADVWIKAGTVCDDQTLTVDWSGNSEADPVIIGSYYVSGGAAFQLTPDNPNGPPSSYRYSNGSRAEITGTYKSQCRAWPSQCAWNSANAIPSSQYVGLVNVNARKYVTIQDLTVRDSAGLGIVFEGNPSGGKCTGAVASACEFYLTIQRNAVSHTAGTGVNVLEGRFAVIRDNVVDYTNIAKKDSQPWKSWGAAIHVGRCYPCSALIENNDVWNSYGEGIGPYGVSVVLVRGNRIANGRRASIYTSGGRNVVEQNLISGGPVIDEPGLGDPAYSNIPAYWAMSFVREPSTTAGEDNPEDTTKQLFRNNLSANHEKCFNTGIANDAGAAAYSLGGRFVGNTCVSAAGNRAWGFNGTVGKVNDDGIDVANNIFATTSGAPSCDSAGDPKVTARYNYWASTSPADSDCRSPGTGDVYGSYAGLGLTAHNFDSSDKRDFPLYTWFSISKASGAAGRGVAMTDIYLRESDWTWVLAHRKWLPACQSSQVSGAEFVKALSTDYCGAIRSTGATNIGALGSASGGAVAYMLTVD
jgi:hypothetical protein